jgi:allantoate deiminase
LVSAPTLERDLATLAGFSAPGPGVTRLAWSPELLAGYDWLAGRLRALGLDVEIDPAGNLVARWDAGNGPAVVVGSHLDTVPRGGRFDGALGVLAGMHALRMLRERGVEPARPLWLVAFMDEEGTRFGTSLLGSRAFAGEPVADLAGRADGDGVTVADAMRAAGFDPARLGEARAIDRVGAYVELHVEQGPALERAGADVGVVEAICGMVGLRATLLGEANHAGTTPMDLRRDALAAAARAVLAVRETALEAPGVVATAGTLDVHAGAYNVVPGAVELSIDLRAPRAGALAAAEEALRARMAAIAAEENVECVLDERHRLAPVPMDAALREHLRAAAAQEDATALELASGAGHDAMVIGRHVPAGMLFAPSRDGLSHNPGEHTSAALCETAARVLARALERIGGTR